MKLTRLIPADLIEVQQQANVTADGTIADVIKALQFNKNTPALNTDCPTCVVKGAATGFIAATIGKITGKIPCPTCKGNLLYHTVDGAITPPTNPFNAPIVVTRMLPADLKEALAVYPEAATLSAMIMAMQGDLIDAPANNCPQCSATGKIPTGNKKTICPLCSGYAKTRQQYSFADGKATLIIPVIPLPNPRKNPPVNIEPQ